MARPQVALVGRTKSIDLSLIFGRKLKKIDKEVAEFLGNSEMVSFKEPSNFHANCSETPPIELPQLCQGTVLGILACLDELDASSEVLVIPKGQDELNLILGVFEVPESGSKVLYLEHEHEAGREEEYHLHCRPHIGFDMAEKGDRRYLSQTF